MEDIVYSLKSEYDELLAFVLELQEEEMQNAEQLLRELKEQESKIKQRERFLQEQEKRRTPNIAMFSPLDSADTFDMGMEWKDELAAWKDELPLLSDAYIRARERAAKIERLKQFLVQMAPQFSQAEIQKEKG